MSVNIIDNFRLGTDLPLDSRYVVDSYYDVSLYWYAGMQVFQKNDNQLYWYDGSIWSPVIDTSMSGNYATISYVDGSLLARDLSINQLFIENDNQDISIGYLNNWNISQDSSIDNLRNRLDIIDSSVVYLDSSINQLFNQKADLSYIDGSLAARDLSINYLYGYNSIQDASILAIEASLGDYVRKDGDTMSGDLIIQTDLSVNGKGVFGQFNVSGTSFPGSPSSGDKFYRTDLEIDFQYDSSRGKWLSVNRNTFSAGTNRSNAGNTKYLKIGEAVMDSITGIHLFSNGVILKMSVQNNRTVSGAGRSLELRVNNSTTYKETITITAGNTGAHKFTNLDVSAGDIIQLLTIPGSSRIDDVIFNFEVAERG